MKFYRQYSVGSYVLDFYCPELKLAIELDGGQHGEVNHQERDAARSAYLKREGIELIRFWNNDVTGNMEGVFDRMEDWIRMNAPHIHS
jgi:very-short-patch-repair endonuclease